MPALCGIKPSCLFSLKREEDVFACQKVKNVCRDFKTEGKKIAVIVKDKEHSLYFVYDQKAVGDLCKNRDSICYLEQKGYPVEKGSAYILAELFSRLKNRKDFPHEIGLFLGYPLSDVIQFEKRKGNGCAYCGYWKVYSDVDNALELMKKYRDCRSFCKYSCQQGYSILETVNKYKKTYGGLYEKGDCIQYNNR